MNRHAERIGRPRGRFFWWKLAIVSTVAFAMFSTAAPQTYSFSDWHWVMQEGDRGDDVAELQSRLRFLGFYGGNVDGSFGSGTRRAVIGFQREFGMTADGRVGPQTKLKLANATKAWNTGHMAEYYRGGGGGGGGGGATAGAPAVAPTTHGFSASELKILERTVYGEARGEPYIGQVAVAAVVLNRIENPAFPNTISGVVFQPRAFTAVDDGQIWLEPDESAAKAVRDALNGWDPSDGALYYFNPVTATSRWIWTRPQIKQIGKHIFCM